MSVDGPGVSIGVNMSEPESSGAVLSLGALDKSVSVDGPGVSIGVNMSC